MICAPAPRDENYSYLRVTSAAVDTGHAQVRVVVSPRRAFDDCWKDRSRGDSIRREVLIQDVACLVHFPFDRFPRRVMP